jgi:DNA-binding NarL/FixJ family response regulator
MPAKSRIIIIDDHPIFRAGLVDILVGDPRFEIVGQAANYGEFWNKLPDCDANLVITEIEMPGKTGLDLAQRLKQERPDMPVIVLTMHKDKGMVNEALNAGVDGYVLKEDPAIDLILAILKVRAGAVYLSPTISGFLLNRKEKTDQLYSKRPRLDELSPMEWRVLHKLADNLTSRAIGEKLFISHRTVQKHRTNICEKLALQGSNRLLEFVLTHKDEIANAGRQRPF